MSKAAFVIVLVALACAALVTAGTVALTMHRDTPRPSCRMYDRSLCL